MKSSSAAVDLPVAPAKCATCDALAQAPLVCQDCHQLLAHVQGADYFELFGLAPKYAIDERLLAERYLAISRNIHPDKFANAGNEMQSFALRASAAVNRAHDVLRDGFLRAEYMLESAGGKSAAQDKRVPEDLLTTVMMLREEIEEAKHNKDAATLKRIGADVESRQRRSQSRIVELCEGIATAAQQQKDALRLELNAMKYLNNLLGQISHLQ